MRPTYGFVIRAVAAESPTINRLAELLDVSKQAASKLADEMHRAGFLERTEDTADRRHTRLTLSRKGKAVFASSARQSNHGAHATDPHRQKRSMSSAAC